jgi:peptidoglycan/xylan/chitin deacetylase (PgdA/CDA1 family)
MKISRILEYGAAMAAMLAAATPGAVAAAAAQAQLGPAAVILMYHRFSNDKHPSASISTERFQAHVNELKTGGYNVIGLPKLIAAMEANEPLKERSVVITMDEAYRSVFDQAWPVLKKSGLPFTVFVSSYPTESKQKDFMTWAEIETLAKAGVTIGAKSHTQTRLVEKNKADLEWELQMAAKTIRAKLGMTPQVFAYPFGLASRDIQRIVHAAGYKAAVGHHSGVAHRLTDRYYLPRFSLNGGLDRFRSVANAEPLPAFDITPSDPLLSQTNNPPAFGFTIAPQIDHLDRLACYHSSFGKLPLERLGRSRIEVRFTKPFPTGRSRINCTMPGTEDRWRWFGMQFYVAGP